MPCWAVSRLTTCAGRPYCTSRTWAPGSSHRRPRLLGYEHSLERDGLLVLKLILTPLLIAAATIVARRWGPVAGGWIAGLPLTSGPVSVFLAVEQGSRFAAQAAQATLLGMIAVVVFCVAYARAARVLPWPGAAAVGLGIYLLIVVLMSFTSPGLAVVTMATLLVAWLALRWLTGGASEGRSTASPRWELPLRIIVAAIIVLGLTGAAGRVGPHWSGLLSPFPVFAGVMAVFTHRFGSATAARHLLRGVVVGSFAFTTFFLITALALPRTSLLVAYILAICAALAVQTITLMRLVVPAPAPS